APIVRWITLAQSGPSAPPIPSATLVARVIEHGNAGTPIGRM
ncbi:MAG: hypothetical protein AVDCRST_MAG02-1996, partial [uncultured Rubrobacteraceae bacterium]